MSGSRGDEFGSFDHSFMVPVIHDMLRLTLAVTLIRAEPMTPNMKTQRTPGVE